MQISTSHDYAATPDQVAAMLLDRDFLEKVAARAGARSATIHTEGHKAELTLHLNPPSSVAGFIGKELRLTQVMSWDEPGNLPRCGSVEVMVHGMPVTMTAQGRLSATENGTLASYEGELVVQVPLIGKRLEREAEPFIRAALNTQAEVGKEWLAERHSTK